MVLALQIMALAATMLLTVFMMGAVNAYHPYDSYLLVGLPIVVMPPTVALLLANQLLDNSPGVKEILPVTQTYDDVSRGGHTYYAVVPARMPPRLLFPSPEAQERFHLPYSIWHLLVAGHSTLTLRVHDGRFGFPWFSVVTFAP